MNVRMLTAVALVAVALAGCAPPTSTPTRPAAASPNPAPSATPGAELAPGPAGPDLAATRVALGQPRVFAGYNSPDEAWRAEILIYDCTPIPGEGDFAYEVLQITDGLTGKTTRLVDAQLRVCGGLGAFGLEGLFWSANGHYFYYTDGREGGPDGACRPWTRPTLRLEAASGSVLRLGSGPLSPDGSRLATWQEQALVVWDLNAGEVLRLPLSEAGVAPGSIAWAEAGQALAFIQTQSACPPLGRSVVTFVALSEGRPEVVLDHATGLAGLSWVGPDQLQLQDEAGQNWALDLTTGQLESIP